MSLALSFRAPRAVHCNAPQPTPPENITPSHQPPPSTLEVPPPEINEPELPGHFPFHDPLRPVPFGIHLG